MVLAVLVVTAVPFTRACDLCGCYTPQLEALPQESDVTPFGQQAMAAHEHLGAYAAIAEQFTYFGTVQVDGREIPNTTDQHLDSSITQFVAGYSLTDRFDVQLNVPFIYRSFRRPEGFTIDQGNVAGIGDVSLLGKIVLFHYSSPASREFVVNGKNPVAIQHQPDFTASIVALAGVKFPTGDPSRIKEEFSETEIPGAPLSGIHGHDLTLGTGSYDGIFGGQASLRWKNWFAQADAQFTWRSDGAYGYGFANDFSWSGGPGYYFVRTRSTILGCQCVVSGEYKGLDRFRGDPAEDTGITSVFIGPRIVGARGRVSGEMAAEFPVLMQNTALQVVPDYRLRAGFALSW
ncbi:MAG: hypothetical protein JO354_11560 [Verrucomicrobia bacterium]|nr:hypothetical protein [Verrucomicrobiota bacterium]